MASKDFPAVIQDVDNVDKAKPPRLTNTYIAAVSAYLYIVVLGLVVAYSAPATVDMKKKGSRFLHITQDEITWIASLPVMTSGIGTLVSAYVTQKVGRRGSLMFFSLPYLLSWLMVAYAPTIAWIYAGRLITGFCFGFSGVSVPAYVVEIAPVTVRGLFASGFQVSYSVGVLVMMLLGYVLRWSWLAVSGAVVVTIGACLMLFMPESPAWLLRESRRLEAEEGLKFLRGGKVDTEKEIQATMETLKQEAPINLKQFLEPTVYKPILIGIGLMFFQQFSGINAVTSYNVEIFQNTGSPIDAQSSAVIFAVVQIVFSILSSIFMDRAGRRALFIASGIFLSLALAVLGIYSILPRYGYNMSGLVWIPLVCLIVYIAAFNIGYGPVPMVMTPEMAPLESRSVVLAIVVVTNGLFSFTVTKSFDFFVTNIGYYGLYWAYATFSLIGTVFAWYLVPETKGRTISDINRSFQTRTFELNARKEAVT